MLLDILAGSESCHSFGIVKLSGYWSCSSCFLAIRSTDRYLSNIAFVGGISLLLLLKATKGVGNFKRTLQLCRVI